ncbi:MAG TPA: general secretion pathway protein GspF, partial [Cellvibrionales bacterium]|nr:general secretion pathway protein GspF [Cellvibrionales bacterium]
EFRKTASVMKMVIDGFAGAGTITLGGYDYHTGDRATGEQRDLRAGRCMGACLEYAARKGIPLMLYVFSDGSVFSNGMIDDS